MDRNEDWHKRGIRSAVVLEALGGVKAVDGSLFQRSAMALIGEFGWTADMVADEYRRQLFMVHGGLDDKDNGKEEQRQGRRQEVLTVRE